MNYPLLFVAILSSIGAFFEYCQHNEYSKKHPDYEKCPSGVFGFVLIAVLSVLKLIF